MVTAGTGLLAVGMALLALVPAVAVALPACLLAGLAWISVMSSLNVSAQLALPAWVRSRGLAVSLAVFFGSMTAGSIVWGFLAGVIGTPGALLLAAAGALAGILASRSWHLWATAPSTCHRPGTGRRRSSTRRWWRTAAPS
jgi:hypothetical protein